MTAKIISGASFGGAVDYIMNKTDAEYLISEGIRLENPTLMSKDFETIRNTNKRILKPVTHITINFHKDDKQNINNEKMKLIAASVLNGMGYDNSQYLVVRHHDTAHPHFHILANRVDYEGKCVSDSYSQFKLMKIRREIEKEFPELTPAVSKNINQINENKLKGKDAISYAIYKAINKEIKNCSNIDSLINFLKNNYNITTEYKYKRGRIDQIEGIKFQFKNTWVNGSKVDKNCSYNNLLKQINFQNSINKMPSKMYQAQKNINSIFNPNLNLIKGGNKKDIKGLGFKKASKNEDYENGM